MDLNFPNADSIDSTCERRVKGDGDVVGADRPRCKEEAVTYFTRRDGTRLYVCETHAKEVLRFPTADAADLPDDYNELRSLASEEGINIQNPSRSELTRRLLRKRRKDPDDLPENPRVRVCGKCGCITLDEEVDRREDRCLCCSTRPGGVELDVDVCYPPGR